MRRQLYADLQIVRKFVMEDESCGREWERSLQKYDELAIRYDQMNRVFDLLFGTNNKN